MTPTKKGETLHKVQDQNINTQLPAVKMAVPPSNPIEALRYANQALGVKLEHLDKIVLTEEKVKQFQPSNPESGCNLTITDANNNKFTTGNSALVARALEVIGFEILNVRKATEAEILEFAAVKAA